MCAKQGRQCVSKASLAALWSSSDADAGALVNVQHKATRLTVMCKDCKNIKVLPCKRGMGSVMIPRSCDNSAQAVAVGQDACSLDPFVILPNKTHCVDQQTLKLQVSSPTQHSSKLVASRQADMPKRLCYLSLNCCYQDNSSSPRLTGFCCMQTLVTPGAFCEDFTALLIHANYHSKASSDSCHGPNHLKRLPVPA